VPLIFGPLEVEAVGSSSAMEVMFFIDDELEGEDYYFNQPFNWTWDKKGFGKYKLTILGWGEAYFTTNIAFKDIYVWKFF
jgi:hypothetical protein